MSSEVVTGGGARLNVRQAAFIGVGAMFGAGIFSLLGAAGEVAGAAVWISFLLAGAIAMLQGYSFAKFGARLPDRVVSFEEVAERLLREVREVAAEHLNGSVDRAVVTVPAYFGEAQRDAVRRAAAGGRVSCWGSSSPASRSSPTSGRSRSTRSPARTSTSRSRPSRRSPSGSRRLPRWWPRTAG